MGITDLLLRRVARALVLGNFRKFKKGNLTRGDPCKTQKLRITLYLVDKTDDLSTVHGVSDNSERLLQRGKEGSQGIHEFLQQRPDRTSKDGCSLKETMDLRLRNLGLFYVWEDEQV